MAGGLCKQSCQLVLVHGGLTDHRLKSQPNKLSTRINPNLTNKQKFRMKTHKLTNLALMFPLLAAPPKTQRACCAAEAKGGFRQGPGAAFAAGGSWLAGGHASARRHDHEPVDGRQRERLQLVHGGQLE